MNKLHNEIRELNIDELDAVTGGGGDCSGPGIGMGGVGHAIKQAVGAVLSVAKTIIGIL
jgi:bacteriocin-like protein